MLTPISLSLSLSLSLSRSRSRSFSLVVSLYGTLKEVGICGEFTLDGRASSGAASRTLSVEWRVSSTSAGGDEATVAVAVAAVESALVPFQGSLLAALNASALEIGVEFTFTLVARNFLGGMDETAVSVTRR